MQNIILLTSMLLLSFTVSDLFAQEKGTVIQGKVISFEESFPIEGVRVVVKGTSTVTGTGVDGVFALTIYPGDKVLEVSVTGYQSQEVSISKAREYNIVLRRADAVAAQERRRIH